ncbi:MAG: TIGR00296 family protein [Candidatus Hadarchaeales archaeon]
MPLLTLEEGTTLVKVARNAIKTYLERGTVTRPPKVSGKLKERRGVFVTLTSGGELRGCIGYPIPHLPLIEAIIDAAISSATRDPRFPPVTKDEIDEIEIEVSVLTDPSPIKVKHPSEYPKSIVIGRDGLIVELGAYAGLLLPQVAVELGWDAEEFLSQACMKAGLPPDAWFEKGIKISRFTAQIFSEKEPNGEVFEKKL